MGGFSDKIVVRKRLRLRWKVDECEALIAGTWPRTIDDSAARRDWGWTPRYDLESMTSDMLESLTAQASTAQPPTAAVQPPTAVVAKVEPLAAAAQPRTPAAARSPTMAAAMAAAAEVEVEVEVRATS